MSEMRNGTARSILIVDDEDEIRTLLSEAFRSRGYVPVLAATAQTALDRVREELPAVALVDLRLPDMDGLEVIRKIKAYSPETECIVLTGHASQDSAIEAVNLGAYGYVQKPCNMTQLTMVAQRAIEKREAEEALRRSQETLHVLLNTPPDVALLLERDGTIVALNEAAARSMGGHPDDLVGACVFDLLPPDVAAGRRAQGEKVFRSGKPVRFEDEREGRYLDHYVYPVLDAQGDPVQIAIVARDVTDRKMWEKQSLGYQAQLRSLASQLSLAEERERRRIATELHDRIGQMLAISNIKLAALREQILFSTSSGLTGDVDELRGFMEQMIHDIRSLTFELSSPVLYELGFVPAVEWLAERLEEQNDLTIDVEDDGRPKPFGDEIQVVLFQVVRELLVNVVKHAETDHAKVSLRREGGKVCVKVEDDGVGFDTSLMASHASEIGFGLFSIRERVHYLGGEIAIDSEAGAGTRVVVWVPVGDDG